MTLPDWPLSMAAKPFSLGYIGVGLMGGPMSQRLAKLGWEVTAYDIAPERLRVAHAAGIKVAASPAEAARAGEVVLLNLPTNDAVIRRLKLPGSNREGLVANIPIKAGM